MIVPCHRISATTFYRVMAYFNKRRDEIGAALGRGERYTKYALDKLSHWGKAAGGHNVTLVNRENDTFEVITAARGYHLRKGSNKQVVKLEARRCTCMKWQCFGIPCSHVQAVCASVAIDHCQYIESYYRLSVYSQCYAMNFQPIPHDDY
ncbi:hypothetical protein Scep_027604 [Stephania cephalantha]|uniref:SWIM-type domain-containing protein n=1 Tax=Stephania cephalantha TaxID=152367 RepID=A0AAP0EBP2_9MAGN